jgi:hypothetical protein
LVERILSSYYKKNAIKALTGNDEADFMMTGSTFVGAANDAFMLATSGVLWSMCELSQQRDLVTDKAFRIYELMNVLRGRVSHAPVRQRGAESLGIVHGLATVEAAAARNQNERAIARVNSFGFVQKGNDLSFLFQVRDN